MCELRKLILRMSTQLILLREDLVPAYLLARQLPEGQFMHLQHFKFWMKLPIMSHADFLAYMNTRLRGFIAYCRASGSHEGVVSDLFVEFMDGAVTLMVAHDHAQDDEWLTSGNASHPAGDEALRWIQKLPWPLCESLDPESHLTHREFRYKFKEQHRSQGQSRQIHRIVAVCHFIEK